MSGYNDPDLVKRFDEALGDRDTVQAALDAADLTLIPRRTRPRRRAHEALRRRRAMPENVDAGMALRTHRRLVQSVLNIDECERLGVPAANMLY